MFRKKKISERLPLSTGVGEGSHRLKKVLTTVLISVIVVTLLIGSFSVSAMSSNGATLKGVGSYIYLNGGFDYEDAITNGDNKIEFVYYGMDKPYNDYVEFCGYFEFDSPVNYGTIEITYYLMHNVPATSVSNFASYCGLYDVSTDKKLCNVDVEDDKLFISYTGAIPKNLRVQSFFSCPNPDTVMNIFSVFWFNFIPDSQGDNTNKVIENQNKNTEEIKNAINNQTEIEKQEAQQSGNGSIDSVTSVVPDYSSNLLSAFSSFVSNMVHTEKQCVITIPEIKTPKMTISSLGIEVDEVVLMDSRQINLYTYYDKIFTKSGGMNRVMSVVRALLTSGLIIFAFKEFYGIFELLFTLKETN